MMVLRVAHATRVMGGPEYSGLPIQDVRYPDGTTAMRSHWEPTPKELELMASGLPVVLEILGSSHPPVRLEVGDAAAGVRPTMFVVMGNDYPESVWSDGAEAEAYCERLNAESKKETERPGSGRSRIYWRVYDFKLDQQRPKSSAGAA